MATGLICLFSASYAEAYYKQGGNSTYFVFRQSVFAVAGIVAMLIISKFDYHKWVRLSLPVLLFSLVLLSTVKFVPKIWKTVNGATRWIGVGDLFTFQPSEIMKFAVIIFFATMATVFGRERMKKFRYGILPFLIVIGATAVLLYFEPHMSATVIIGVMGVVLMFLGGASVWQLGLLGGVGVAGAAGLIIFKENYWQDRINIWLDPFSDALGLGWQGVQSQIAVGSGGLWGLGLGQSRQKHLYLPEPANDFIFAVICEELGFVFTSVIIIAFMALIWRGYYIARRAGDKLGTLIAAGITTQIAVQVIINMCVVTGLIPITGASLPFFSYGGTSLLMLLAEVGVLLNVSRSIPSVKGK